MTSSTRVVSALLVALLLAAPLASTAAAQQPAQPPAPDLFQETLKAERGTSGPKALYTAGAIVTNIFLVPGRVLTCAAGAVVGVAVLGATLGTAYRAASTVWHEGCGGKWIVTGEDIRPETVSGRHTDAWEQR